jgi:hypothetical protein
MSMSGVIGVLKLELVGVEALAVRVLQRVASLDAERSVADSASMKAQTALPLRLAHSRGGRGSSLLDNLGPKETGMRRPRMRRRRYGAPEASLKRLP